MNDELSNQLIKNLIYLLRQVLTNNIEIDLKRLFKKSSFIGRKMMLNISEGITRIAGIVQFYQVALQLFEDFCKQKDNSHTRSVTEPILELVYRTYSDEQYKESKIKDISLEIVEYLSNNLDKNYFVQIYNEVKS